MTPDKLFQCLFSKSKTPEVIEVTHSELLQLIASSKLIPGASYRITDYVAVYTTAAASAGHQFDIITTAINENTLSENCSAAVNSNDTSNYFDGCNLSAWKIKYTVNPEGITDNYPETGGKGYIYEMTDEHDNTAPCDFKNFLVGDTYYIFSKEVTDNGQTIYEDASKDIYCYGNKVSIAGVSAGGGYVAPKCAFISCGEAHPNIQCNRVENARNVYIRASIIRGNTITDGLSGGLYVGLSANGTTSPFYLISGNFFSLGRSNHFYINSTNSARMVDCEFRRYYNVFGSSYTDKIIFNQDATGLILNAYRALYTVYVSDILNYGRFVENGSDGTLIVQAATVTTYRVGVGTWNSSTHDYNWTLMEAELEEIPDDDDD